MSITLWVVPAVIVYTIIGIAFEALTDFGDGFEWKTVVFWPLFPVVVIWCYLADWFAEGKDAVKNWRTGRE